MTNSPWSEKGVTLTELMVTIAIISIAAAALVQSFSYMTRAVELHRKMTLAINIGQQQIEVLKNTSYYSVIPTSATAYDNNFSPAIPYDTAIYPPSTISIGNNTFTVLTYVERVEASGNTLLSVPPDSIDTGLKRLTVTVVWQSGSEWFQRSLSNLYASSLYANTGAISGTITDSRTGQAIVGADVYAKGETLVHDFSDNTGNYVMSASPGSYTLYASAAGYFVNNSSTTYTVTAGNTATANLTLTEMSSSTVSGAVYVNNHLLISEVVATTTTATIQPNGTSSPSQDAEYVELFNPTTYQISIAAATGNGQTAGEYYKLNTTVGGTAYKDEMNHAGNYVYVSSYVKAGGYYLFSNSRAFVANGVWVTADAYWNDTDVVSDHSWGGLQLTDLNGDVIDQVCWNGGSGPPSSYCNGSYIPTDSTNGLENSSGQKVGNQLVRFAAMSNLGRGTYGSAYNSQDNAVDFQYPVNSPASNQGLNYQPFTSTSPVLSTISGTIAVGSIVTCNDGLSGSTQAWEASLNGFYYATFTLVGVATGTWSVDITSGADFLEISSVTVAVNGTTAISTTIPNGATSPAWPQVGAYNAMLTSSTPDGIITGEVTDPNGKALSGFTVTGTGSLGTSNYTGTTNSYGYYAITAPADTYSLIANPSNKNALYTSEQLSGIVLSAAEINNGNNFTLSGAGRATGYVCDYASTNYYPGVTINVLDGNGNSVGQVITGSNGQFVANNLSTGTYTFEPVLDTNQTATASAAGSCEAQSDEISCTIDNGVNVALGTWTVTGAYGAISGTAEFASSSAPITTGVLVVATTGTIAGSLPPNLSNSILDGTPYYMASTLSDGTFNMNVRASTASATFNLYGWYTTYSGSGTSATVTVTKKQTHVSVTGGETSSGVTLQW